MLGDSDSDGGGGNKRRLYRTTERQVEATKFTEVGYRGRDVDTIICDLVDNVRVCVVVFVVVGRC